MPLRPLGRDEHDQQNDEALDQQLALGDELRDLAERGDRRARR